MKKLFVFKTGASFTDVVARLGDFDDWVLAVIGQAAIADCEMDICIVDVQAGALLPMPEQCAGAIVMGSHAMVTDNLAWSVALEKWLAEAVLNNIPLLGICYGHQLLAKALGGVVDYHPQAPEIGCFAINLLPAAVNDPLFSQLPAHFNAHLTHHQSVIVLPNNAVLLANNTHEPHQAFRVGACAWGVQFHPEYSKAVMLEYIEKQRAVIERCGQDCDAIKTNTEETLAAQQLLALFVKYCFKSLPTSLLQRGVEGD